MYHPRKYPMSWIWVRDRRPAEGRPAGHPDSYPLLACVRTLDQADRIANQLGLVDPIIQTQMPCNHRFLKQQWWSRHPRA